MSNKSSKSSNPRSSYRPGPATPASRSRGRAAGPGRFPLWALGAIVVVVLGVAAFLVWQALAPVTIPDREQFLGLEGTSYDDGATEALYPDPGQKGVGRRWYPALGPEAAPVTVMELSDFNCSHCQDFNQEQLESLLKEYVATGKVRYVVHFYSFSQSIALAEAAMCAAEQGRYFAFEHALFKVVVAGKPNVDSVARTAGVSDLAQFKSCRQEHRYLNTLQDDAIPAAEQLGVRMTPTFIVNGQKVEGNNPTEIRRLIEAALTK